MRAPGRGLFPVLAPAALCAVLLAAADPRGDFPLNDDFQYADSVSGLLQGRGLRLSQWAYAFQVSHIVQGAVPTLLFGASDWVLRLWTMFWGCAAAGLTALLARRFGAREGAALLAGVVLACDPLHLVMSASFHMEVTLMLLLGAACWAFLAHLESGRPGALAAAGLALGLAVLTRQTAALAAVGMTCVLASRRRLGPREAALLWAAPAACAMAWWGWFHLVHGTNWAFAALGPARPFSAAGAAWSVRRVSDVLQTAGLLLAPCALAGLPAALKLPRPGRAEILSAAVLSAGALDGWLHGGMPVMANTISRRGLGVVTLDSPLLKEAGWWGDPRLWRAADAAALLSSLVLLRLLWPRPGEEAGAGRARALLGVTALPVLATAVFGINYDRYLLAWVPAALCASVWAAGAAGRPAWGAGAALAMGLASAAGLGDYFAWNRARWEAGLRAVQRGVPPAKVANGFDWDGRLTMEPNFQRLLAERPAREIGMWDWMTLNRIVALTSFSPQPPRRDFVPIDSVPYRTPFARGERRVYLYGLKAASR